MIERAVETLTLCIYKNIMLDNQIELGRHIQQLRKGKGYTQATFAQKLGIAESTVAAYEAGRNNFTINTLKRIATGLGGELKIEILLK